MIIKKVELLGTVVKADQFPEPNLPEFAFVGRSNVGKSSLLNSLISRKNLARTSGHPGKTQTINFFEVNDSIRLVDLPGYGYAKVSKDLRSKWGKMIEDYIMKRENLKAVIQLIDFRHPPTEDDILMFQWLIHNEKELIVVATKSDKIKRGNWKTHQNQIKHNLSSEIHFPLILYSSLSGDKGRGREELWNEIRLKYEKTD